MNKNLNIEQKVPLSELSTFKVGGIARYLARVTNASQIIDAITFAKDNNLDIYILGSGSNILFSDEGFDGLIIKIENKGVEIVEDSQSEVIVRASAGEIWDDFVLRCIENGYFGIENLSLIPGTVGASVVQNIGAYGVEVKDFVENVEVVDCNDLSIKRFSKSECEFDYRDSVFKKDKGTNYIVVSVDFRLKKIFAPMNEYKDLKNYFQNDLPQDAFSQRQAIIDIRTNKFPDLKVYGTAGSFWKNIICDTNLALSLKARYLDLPIYDMGKGKSKISTAYIIDKICGLKSFRDGDVGLYEKQSLVVTNFGAAKSNDIKNFIKKIKLIVKEKIKIDLEEEVIIFKNKK